MNMISYEKQQQQLQSPPPPPPTAMVARPNFSYFFAVYRSKTKALWIIISGRRSSVCVCVYVYLLFFLAMKQQNQI